MQVCSQKRTAGFDITIQHDHARYRSQVGASRSGKEVKVIDAPVSGGEAGARQRQLCHMVGGGNEALKKSAPSWRLRRRMSFTWGSWEAARRPR